MGRLDDVVMSERLEKFLSDHASVEDYGNPESGPDPHEIYNGPTWPWEVLVTEPETDPSFINWVYYQEMGLGG